VAVAMTATNNHKNTIVIVYPPGGYGTFLEWCLTYFTGQLPAGPQSWPFVDSTGSAHRFRGNQLATPLRAFHINQNFNTLTTYLQSDKSVAFARTHADFKDKQEYISTYHQFIDRFVYIRPSPTTLLLVLNNIVDKAPLNSIRQTSFKYVKEGMDHWEVRESVSRWFDEYCKYMESFYSVADHCVIVELHDLVSDLKTTLDKIFVATGLQWSHPHTKDISAVTEKWLSLQIHLNKDIVCQSIINSIINSTNYDWSAQKLTIYDEAFVQWTLRDLHGMDMKCYNVNVFPTNTTDLRNLLINE
jgi:hypothetical protein